MRTSGSVPDIQEAKSFVSLIAMPSIRLSEPKPDWAKLLIHSQNITEQITYPNEPNLPLASLHRFKG